MSQNQTSRGNKIKVNKVDTFIQILIYLIVILFCVVVLIGWSVFYPKWQAQKAQERKGQKLQFFHLVVILGLVDSVNECP